MVTCIVARILACNGIVDMEYRPAAWDVSPLTSTARGAVRHGHHTVQSAQWQCATMLRTP